MLFNFSEQHVLLNKTPLWPLFKPLVRHQPAPCTAISTGMLI